MEQKLAGPGSPQLQGSSTCGRPTTEQSVCGPEGKLLAYSWTPQRQ